MGDIKQAFTPHKLLQLQPEALWLPHFLEKLYSSRDSGSKTALQRAETITGTSLMWLDGLDFIYKLIPKHNTREFAFYYSVLLAYMAIESILDEDVEQGEGPQICENDICKAATKIELDLAAPNANEFQEFHKERFSNNTGVLKQLQAYASDSIGETVAFGETEVPAIVYPKITAALMKANMAKYNSMRKTKDAHLVLLKSYFKRISKVSEREAFCVECIKCLQQVLGEDLGRILVPFLHSLWYLRRNEIIPDFYGVSSVSQTKNTNGQRSGWVLCEGESDDHKVMEVLKMHNIFAGFVSPAMLDVKVGSNYMGRHRFEPGGSERHHFSWVCSERRSAITERWRAYKKQVRSEYDYFESYKQIQEMTPDHIHFDEAKGKLSASNLQDLLKSWRQEVVINQTTQKVLGFRVCGCSVTVREGRNDKFALSTAEGMSLSESAATSCVRRFFQKHQEVATTACHKLLLLRNWLATQPFFHFYATSIAIGYDQIHPHNCDVRWLDFSHAIMRTTKAVSFNGEEASNDAVENNKSIVFGLDNLLDIIESVANASNSVTT